MNTNKFILSGIAGGVVFFLLGYVFYGMLLSDFFMTHAGPAKGVNRATDHMLFLYIILGNLLFGFLLAYIFGKASVSTVSNGLVTGAIVGFLASSSFGCVNYATTWISSRTSVLADVATYTVISAIAGAAVAWVAGMGKKTA
jgi:uncharacterized membrane protein